MSYVSLLGGDAFSCFFYICPNCIKVNVMGHFPTQLRAGASINETKVN